MIEKKNIEAFSRTSVLNISLVAFTTLTTLLFSSPANAITFVKERNLLPSNDQIEWSSLGKILNPFAPNPNDFLSNSFSGKSSNGLKFSVNIPPTEGDITRPFIFQNNPPAQTNFAPDEYLLFTGFSPTVIPTGNSNPLTIVFDRNVKAAGAQIAASGSENINYEVSISAFDDRNNLLETFSRQGVSSGARDDSAVFLGVKSDTAKIKKLVFQTTSPKRGFGIDRVSIATVNEPNASLILLIFGALVLSFKSYKFN